MPAGGSYSGGKVGDSVAKTLKRSPATRVSYVNTRRSPAIVPVQGTKAGTVKDLPKP